MKKFLGAIVLTVCAWAIVVSLVYIAMPDKQTHWGVKNCELSEISPDFSPQEKADCRIARSKK